jgi:hypothetical protein
MENAGLRVPGRPALPQKRGFEAIVHARVKRTDFRQAVNVFRPPSDKPAEGGLNPLDENRKVAGAFTGLFSVRQRRLKCR